LFFNQQSSIINPEAIINLYGWGGSTVFNLSRLSGSTRKLMKDIEEIGRNIVHSAIKVHKALGPGLLESVYQKCLAYELEKTELTVACEVPLPVKYETVIIDAGFRIDMMIQQTVIVENKTVDKIAPIHEAQLLTYLKLTNLKLGFLLNWNVPLMKDGIKRMVNNLKQ